MCAFVLLSTVWILSFCLARDHEISILTPLTRMQASHSCTRTMFTMDSWRSLTIMQHSRRSPLPTPKATRLLVQSLGASKRGPAPSKGTILPFNGAPPWANLPLAPSASQSPILFLTPLLSEESLSGGMDSRERVTLTS